MKKVGKGARLTMPDYLADTNRSLTVIAILYGRALFNSGLDISATVLNMI
jgi:hypothetical protein